MKVKYVMVAAVIIVIIVAISVVAIACAPSRPVAPVQQVEEEEDCDDEDRAKKQWEECGIGVLIPSGSAPKTPAKSTPKPRSTRR